MIQLHTTLRKVF